MLFWCGGHGLCSTQGVNGGLLGCNPVTDPSVFIRKVELNFLEKYLMNVPENDTATGFDYMDQCENWYQTVPYSQIESETQATNAPSVSGSGAGILVTNPIDDSGFLGLAATPANNAVNIAIAAPKSPQIAVTDPELQITYTGTGTLPTTNLYAQLVDNNLNTVVDNQATPFSVPLAGKTHSIDIPMTAICWSLTQSSRIKLQITDASDVFDSQGSTGFVALSAKVVIPTVAQGTAIPLSEQQSVS